MTTDSQQVFSASWKIIIPSWPDIGTHFQINSVIDQVCQIEFHKIWLIAVFAYILVRWPWILFHVCQLCPMSAFVNNMATFDVCDVCSLPSMYVHYIWCMSIYFHQGTWYRSFLFPLIKFKFNTITLSNKFDWISIAFNWHCLVVMHPKFDRAFSNWCVGGKCVILAESIAVHFKAVHFEVSKIISMDTDGYHFVKTIVISKCKTFLAHRPFR